MRPIFTNKDTLRICRLWNSDANVISLDTIATNKSVYVKNIIKQTHENAIHVVLGSALSLEMYCLIVIVMQK